MRRRTAMRCNWLDIAQLISLHEGHRHLLIEPATVVYLYFYSKLLDKLLETKRRGVMGGEALRLRSSLCAKPHEVRARHSPLT